MSVFDNKSLWNSVCVTDPSSVKPITGKQYRGNSPKPYWLIEKATERFGPCGIGWGVTVKSEKFERLSDTDVLHVAVVSVWYVLNGQRSETFDQMGGTKASYWVKGKKDGDPGYLMVDEDAAKKSVTDGLTKCLSMLGFAGDIFSGRWDDSKYVEWAEMQYDPMTKVLNDFTAQLVQLHEEGNTLEAVRMWYEERPGDSNEAVEYMWSELREHSALRSAIKANKPEPKGN